MKGVRVEMCEDGGMNVCEGGKYNCDSLLTAEMAGCVKGCRVMERGPVQMKQLVAMLVSCDLRNSWS